MYRSFLISAATVASLASAQAATYLPVPPVPGSVGMSTFAINNNDTIAGGWFDANGIEHGFIGSLQGSFITFDYSGVGVLGTEIRGINDNGSVIGFAPNQNFIFGNEFVRDPGGNVTTITKNGTPLDGIAQGITNKSGTPFAGDYVTVTRYAYIGRNGAWQQDLAFPFNVTRSAARGMNNAGTVVGYFGDTEDNTHGFIDAGGTAIQIDYPGSSATFLEDVSDNGLVTGIWADALGNDHAFTLDSKKGAFTSIVPPGNYANVQVYGLNNAGLVAVNTDAASGPNNFIYCPHNCPGGGGMKLPTPPRTHSTGGRARAYPDSHRIAAASSGVALP